MTFLHQLRTGRRTPGTLSAGVALLAIAAIAPASANAAACTQIVTGPHSGVLNVAANQKLCMSGATQTGAVNVAPGGGLSVSGSIITGAITLQDGYTEFRMCASKTVRGAISATGGRTAIMIGGAGLGALLCPANTIDGAVTLATNKAGVTLAGNRIAGAVASTGNLVRTTLSANQIGGALTCKYNIPAPVNAGVANAVVGGRSGQTCAVTTF